MSTMHRRKPYLPDSDVGKKSWMEQFITQIERDPDRYGFDDARMFEYYQRTIRTFIKAVEAVRSPLLHTPGAVRAKNDARKEAVALCRRMAMSIKWDPSISDDEKRSLGINIDEAPAERAKLPEGRIHGAKGYPRLVVLNSPNGGHVIRYGDPTSPKRAKPKGVSHMLLFGAIGENRVMGLAHARLLGAYTNRTFEIVYPSSCGLEGLYVTYYGRWLTTRGEMSPFSPGISKIIGETHVKLHESDFRYIFGDVGAEELLMQGAAPALPEMKVTPHTPPLLEPARERTGGMFAALEGATQAGTMQTLAMLETRLVRSAAPEDGRRGVA